MLSFTILKKNAGGRKKLLALSTYEYYFNCKVNEYLKQKEDDTDTTYKEKYEAALLYARAQWRKSTDRKMYIRKLHQLKKDITTEYPDLNIPPAEEVPRPFCYTTGNTIGLFYVHNTALANYMRCLTQDGAVGWIVNNFHLETIKEFEENYSRLRKRFDEMDECPPSREDIVKIRETIVRRCEDEEFVIPSNAYTLPFVITE